MDLSDTKKDLKFYRQGIMDLEQDLKRVDILLDYSTGRTYPILILRRTGILRQISTFKTMINIIKNDLSILSRP